MSLTAVLTLSETAQAAPSADVIQKIESAYSPASEARVRAAGYSLFGCSLESLKLTALDPVTKDPGETKATIYRSPFARKSSPAKTILLLPPTGGENALDRGYANTLCLAGFKVVLISGWASDDEVSLDLGMHDKGALRVLTAVRRMVDYLQASGAGPIGILGTSVGAMGSALALGYDARIKAGVLIVGGVGMAEIIARTDEPGAAKLRAARLKHHGFKNLEDYEAALRARILIEPADFANYSGTKRVLAFNGTLDSTVPLKNQRDLARVFGAKAEDYEGDHGQTILRTFAFKQKAILDFFGESLK